MNKKMKSVSELYELSLSLVEKKTIDISQLSEMEKQEIEQNVKLIQMIQGSEKSIAPRKESLSLMLENLHQEFIEEESYYWRSFFSDFFTQRKSLAYVLPALLIIVGLNLASQPTFDIQEAEALTSEIQKDFLSLTKDMEEMETLNMNLLSDNFDTTLL